MEYKLATVEDIDAVMKLHAKYQIDTIAPEDKKDGFVTTSFSRESLRSLIEQERGLFIAKEEGEVLAYVMAASWYFWSKWEMFAFMIENLPHLKYKGIVLSVENSYQYGPICIDKRVRGTEVLYKIFEIARLEMAKRYPVLVTFVNKKNPRSFAAHTRKLGLEVLQEFEYNDNSYWELACLTK